MKATQPKLEHKSKKESKTKEEKQKEKNKARKREPWMSVPPTEEEKGKSKPYQGKNWHWFPDHKLWTLHTEAQCKGILVKKDASSKESQDNNNIKKMDLILQHAIMSDSE